MVSMLIVCEMWLVFAITYMQWCWSVSGLVRMNSLILSIFWIIPQVLVLIGFSVIQTEPTEIFSLPKVSLTTVSVPFTVWSI